MLEQQIHDITRYTLLRKLLQAISHHFKIIRKQFN